MSRRGYLLTAAVEDDLRGIIRYTRKQGKRGQGKGVRYIYRDPFSSKLCRNCMTFVATCSLGSNDSEVRMSRNLEALEAEVMTLSPVDRTHLLERLIVSLDEDAEVEAEWRAEAERRESELASDSAVAVPGEEAMSRLRARLKQ